MFESHFGLRENPFASGHQPRYVFPSHEHQEATAHLRYGMENLEPFVLITGEVGTGKTTALFEALGELQSRVSVALITNSALTRNELLEEICLRFGIPTGAAPTKPQAMAQLERHLLALRGRGERAILILDEAQNLQPELLEEIRLLSNLEANGDKLLQIFLVGQPELEAKLSRPELRQLRQRIGVHYRLRPLEAADTQRYIHHRIAVAGGDALRIFPPDACASVHAATNGIPREINQLCAQALLDAFVAEEPVVRPEHVRAAAEETAFQSVLPASETDPRLPPPPAWPAAVPPPLAAAAPLPDRAPAAPSPATPAEIAAPPVTPEPPDLEVATETARWEAWVASLTGAPAGRSGAAGEPAQPPPPAAQPPAATPAPIAAEHAAPGPPSAPAPTAAQPPAPVAPPQPVAVAPAPPPEAQPPRPTPAVPQELAAADILPAESEAVAPALASAPAATRYAAESALQPPESRMRAADWRPPKWTPDAATPAGRRPARLDDRLDARDRISRTAMRWLGIMAVVAVIGIAAVMTFRYGPWSKHGAKPAEGPNEPAASHADSAAATVPPLASPDTLPTTTPVTGDLAGAGATLPQQTPEAPRTARAARRPVLPGAGVGGRGSASVTTPSAPSPSAASPTTPGTSPPPATPPAPSATTATPGAAAPSPARTMMYGISIGTYLEPSRAQAELARVSGSSGLEGKLIEVRNKDGASMYAVVLGFFSSRVAAERKAGELVNAGVVDEARIVPRGSAPKP